MNCPECFGLGEHAVWCSQRKIQWLNWFTVSVAVLLAWALFSLIGCETPNPKHQLASTPRKMRVTFYHKFEQGGNHTSLGVRPKEGVTVAADPRISFHTPVEIPRLAGIVGDGNFTVQDRGSAIKGDHLDIYIEARNRKDARRRMRELSGLPPFMDVVL